MIQALNIPYSSKTDEIMSRYRPIAPKPELPAPSSNTTSTTNSNGTTFDAPLVPEKFRQSPYLRNIWSHLQARPTRTRKRGRASSISPAAASAAAFLRNQQQTNNKTSSSTFMGFSSHSHLIPANLSCIQQPFRGVFVDQHHQFHTNNNNDYNCNVVELPLLSNSTTKSIDLNIVAAAEDPTSATATTVLEEKDLLLQLQVPVVGGGSRTPGVISPRPVRPVGSAISIVGPISEDPEAQVVVKASEEVEAVAEEEALPAVISDRTNKVRMVNSAYKELVGQPECPWLDSMCSGGGGRISGEVMLQVLESGLPVSSNGFSCWVRIEWESSDGKKNWVNAFCEVVKLACLSKDYLFSWRFHTREVSPSASKV